MMLHFAPLIFIPHFLQAVFSCSVEIFSLSKIADIRVVSSAYLMLAQKVSRRFRVSSRSLTSFVTNSRNMLNMVGESRHPGRTPMSTENHYVSCPSITTAHSVSSYKASTILTILGSMPMAIIIFHSAFF